MTEEACPLCQTIAPHFFSDKRRKFYLCSECKALFAGSAFHPDRNAELLRYKEHNNDIDDPRYQDFVKPIVEEILSDFTPESKGLDFGAGTGPVISSLLTEQGYSISLYDPFFHYDPELLKERYDYIACCEVIEHFHHPIRDFSLLRSIMAPEGKLYCMTSLYNESIDLKTWYYKNDLTHVFFYQEETLNYIMDKFGFRGIEIKGNLIIFTG